MTDFDKWLTTEPETRCDDCDKLIVDDFVEDEDYGRIFCDDQCKADYEQSKAEADHDRYMERFYGGDSPVTEREQYIAAWKQKRGLTR
jgi:hypothetical protein